MRTALLLFALFTLASCSSILPKGPPAPTSYTLSSPVDTNNNTSHIPVSLRILLPQAAPGLETEKIALRKTDYQLNYYGGARWSGTLTSLLQSHLVQSFDNTRKLNSVSNDLVAVNQDYSLLVEIQDFQVEYQKGTPVAHIRLTTKLIQAKSTKIIRTTLHEDREIVTADTMQGVVKALDTAYQRISVKIVSDVLKTLQADQKKK